MTEEKLYEVFGDISERHIKEAEEDPKAGKPVRIKWGTAAACLCFLVIAVRLTMPLSAHPRPDTETDDTVPAPMVTIMGKHYTAPNMPVEELPAGHHYLRNLTEKEANHTGLEGCVIYIDPQDEDRNAICLYQERGTSIDEYTVDNTHRQQAYVQWIAVSETESDG